MKLFILLLVLLGSLSGCHATRDVNFVHKMTYWAGSVVWNGLALVFLFRLFYHFYKHPVLLKPATAPFLLKSFADFWFVMCYGVYHLANVITLGETTRNQTWCNVICILGCIYVSMAMFGDALIGFATYNNTLCAINQQPNWLTFPRMITFFFLSAFVGLCWGGLNQLNGSSGPFYDLYCWIRDFGYWSSGGFLFLQLGACMSCLAFCYLQLFFLVKNNVLKSDATDASIEVAKRGVIVLAIEIFCWFPCVISVIINAAGGTTTAEYEMFVGWMMKIQVPVSSGIMQQFTSRYVERLAKSNSNSKAASAVEIVSK